MKTSYPLSVKVVSAFMGLVLFLTPVAALAQSKKRLNFIRDAEIENAIRTLSEPLFSAAGIDGQSVSISLIKDSSLNAFVAGGMNLYLHTGLLQEADNVGQLIGVLAHEIGHISGGHLIRGRDALESASAQAILATLLGVAAALGSGDSRAGAAVMAGGQEIARRAFLSFSRTQESSADQAGLNYLDQAGFSSEGMMEFLDKLADQELLPVDRQVEFVRTHPLTRDRVESVRHHAENSPYKDKKFPADYEELFRRMQAKLLGFLYPQTALLRYKDSDSGIAARYGRAIALYRQGKVSEALVSLEALLKQEPKNAFFYELKGQILFENGRIQESLTPYRKAAFYQPKSALIRTALAHALIETGDRGLLDEAIQHLQESARWERRSPFTWRLLATAWGQKQNEGMRVYAMAEEALARGKSKEANAYALRAEKVLPAGSPGWLRAQDIRSVTDKDVQDSK